MGFLQPRRLVGAATVCSLFVLWPSLARPTTVDSSSFNTAAKFSVDRAAMSLSTGVATIEPRPNAPGYSWLRINFHSFPVTADDLPSVLNGNVQSMDKKWNQKASNPAEYNRSNAIIQMTVDADFKVWQVDMVVPGHTCTIAPFDQDVQKFLQKYKFDGKNLSLKSKGSYVCDMRFMGIASPTFSWDIDVNLPVFQKRDPKP